MNDTMNLHKQKMQKIIKQFSSSNLDNQEEIAIDSNKKTDLLKVIFNYCSEHEICFSLLNTQYEKTEILLFIENKEPLSFVVSFSSNKESSLNDKYKKEYMYYKKQQIIPVIGPDGVGKTTLLKEVIQSIHNKTLYKRFKKIVRRSIIYNILYPLNKMILKKKLGKKPTKDQVDDIYAHLVIFVGWLYYPYLIFQSLFKKKLIFLDRFFNDYLLENIAFLERSTHLRVSWKKLLNSIPKTFWIIHLDAKPEIILNRKDELLKDDILQYKNLNFEIYLQKPSFIYSYINTGCEISFCKEVLLDVGKRIEFFKIRK